MATPINDMNPVYDNMGNLVGTVPVESLSTPAIMQTRNPAVDDSGRNRNTQTECRNYSYFIDPRSYKVRRSGNQHTPDKPWYDSNIEWKYGSEAQQECELWVDVYRCCNDTGVQEKVGTVLVARTRQLSFWLNCDENGKKGKKLVVRQFILEEEINSFYREVFQPDSAFLSRNPGFRLPSSEDLVWGECPLSTKPRDLASYIGLLKSKRTTFNYQASTTTITQAKTSESGNKVDVIPWTAGLESWTTDPTGRDQNGNPTWNVILTDCVFYGPCEFNAEEPNNPPEFFCITVDTIDKVRQLDSGTSSEIPATLSRRGIPRYEIVDRGQTIVLSSVSELLEYNATRVVLDDTRRIIPGTERLVNLSNIGFPCERELVADYQIDVETRYVKLKICYRSDGAILITGGLGDFPAFITTQPTDKGIPIPGTREYDPQSDCCADADFFPDYASDDPRAPKIPPANRSRLQHDLETAEWVLVDSCACEEVYIADVWCWYGDRKISRVHRKNINNPITHVKRRDVIDGRCQETETGVYHPFDRKKDIIFGRQKHITRGLFNGQENMLCYLTSSLQTTISKKYYYDVNDCVDCGRDPYFAVSYGHYAGSGSVRVDDQETNKTPSDTIYSQYQLICNDDGGYTTTNGQSLPKFTFVSESISLESDDIYIMNFYRQGLSDKLDAGNYQINLSYLSGSFYANNVHTGSNVKVGSPFVMNLIDDSSDYNQALICDNGELISYNIVSGSLTNGIYQPSSVNTYGRVYPQIGLIILHPKRLNELLGFNTVTGSNIEGENSFKLFTSISGAASPTTGRTTPLYMTGRNISYKTTAHYFVRVFPHQSNYSNNPTFVSGSVNQIFDTCFITDPTTYITSVGLYDSDRQLIAIAKLSKPVKKTFDTDLVIKIRLNW